MQLTNRTMVAMIEITIKKVHDGKHCGKVRKGSVKAVRQDERVGLDYMDDRIVLSLLVDNTAGVLARVAGLFSRRGYNIESLTVGVTADPRYSRMTVVSLGDQTVLEHGCNRAAALLRRNTR